MSHAKETKEKWSSEVTEHSNALDLQEGVFTWSDPKKIAASLKKSAEKSKRKKGTPYQSAMSMLTFYINRDGKNLDAKQKKVLEDAKEELRELFGRKNE
jgi:putative cell wall-binding protein